MTPLERAATALWNVGTSRRIQWTEDQWIDVLDYMMPAALTEYHAALAEQPEPWKLTPREPTREMSDTEPAQEDQFQAANPGIDLGPEECEIVWRVMWDAAPEPPEE